MNKTEDLMFTTWEKFQLAYIERQMGKKLSIEEKIAVVDGLEWRRLGLSVAVNQTLF